MAVKPSGKNWQSILCQWEGLAAKLSGNIVKYVWANGKAWQPNFGAKVLTKDLWASGKAWQRSFRAKFLQRTFGPAVRLGSKASSKTSAKYFWASGRAWQKGFRAKCWQKSFGLVARFGNDAFGQMEAEAKAETAAAKGEEVG